MTLRQPVTEAVDPNEVRDTQHEIDPIFPERWSPRAMTGESIKEEELARLFEAARWAPSSYNGQPWRFLYAHRDTSHWNRFRSLLDNFNRQWTESAAVLLVILSRNMREGKPARTHSFDTGAAWQNLALQGSRMGLVVHGMEGFDFDSAADELNVPDGYTVEAMAAVGRPAPRDTLPPKLEKREAPSGRMEIDEFAFEGSFPRK